MRDLRERAKRGRTCDISRREVEDRRRTADGPDERIRSSDRRPHLMPFIIDGRRGGRVVAALVAALALGPTPAVAAQTGAPAAGTAWGCPPPPSQAFLFANDKKDYVLAPGGDVE